MVATISVITSGSSRVRYFEKDGYYVDGDPEHRQLSRWHGLGAVELGLTSPNPSGGFRARSVSPDDFEAVLDGRISGRNGHADITLGRIRDGVREHRPGFDITLSAPKSVSIERLFHPAVIDRCHNAAVSATLEFIERELIETRIWDPATGRRDRTASPSMVAATFMHEASRNLDPQLHTHCVIANMTHAPGGASDPGRWRSIEPTALRQNIKLIGAVYRSELAAGLRDSGFRLQQTMVGNVPGFEIAGHDRADIEAFSTRRMEMLAYMAERGWEYNARNAQQAALDTRAAKDEPDRAAMHAAWQDRAAELDLTSQRLPRHEMTAERARQRELPPPDVLEQVCRSVAHLEERASVFPERELVADVLGRLAGRVSLAEVRESIAGLVQDGHLVPAKLSHAPDAFVTDRALRAERGLIHMMQAGQGAATPLMTAEAVRAGLDTRDLTDGQRAAITAILTGADRVIGVQGRAGTGKTRMLEMVPTMLPDRPILALAPSTSATQALTAETGITAKTISWFLTRHQGVVDGGLSAVQLAGLRDGFRDAVLVVDEASMVGTDTMRRLFDIAEGLGISRTVLVGDTRQLRADQAGQPFRQLQQAGMATVEMDEILRQRDPGLRMAVEHVLDGQPAMALENLAAGRGGQLVETPDLAEKAADLWLALSPEERQETALVAPTHAMRAEIHDHIRAGLQEEGVLHGPEASITRLINTHMTRSQLGDARNYHPGDVVAFHQDVINHRVKAGDRFTVTGHSRTDDGSLRVLLADGDGNRRHIDPRGTIRYRLAVYETTEMTVQAGDRIRWTANAPKTDSGDRNLVNGTGAEITHVGRVGLGIRTDDGRDIAMRLDDPQLGHSDHGYSRTIHAAQGMTCDHVIAVLESGHGQLTDQQSFYVEISRARDSAVVLTDNIEQLTETLTANTGERLTALEAIGETAAGREVEREVQPPREMVQGTPQIEPAGAAIMQDQDSVQDPVPSHEAVHETVQTQELDRAVEEEVRDMSAMSLEDHEAEWRELDDMDELTREPVPMRSNEAGMAREEPQELSQERTKDQDFGMEM